MESDLVRIAIVEHIDRTLDLSPAKNTLEILQALLETEGYDLRGGNIPHFLIHSRNKFGFPQLNCSFISQLDVIIAPGYDFNSNKFGLNLAEADSIFSTALEDYRGAVHKSRLALPYYAITSSANYERVADMLKFMGFHVEKLPRRGNVVTQKQYIVH